MKNLDLILVENSLVNIVTKSNGGITKTTLGTITANLAYYGYTLSKKAYQVLINMTDDEATAWWANVDVMLKELTGDNRDMDRFVVYKNFPKEVLEMSECEYWIKQIFMYLGFPKDLFTEEELDREEMNEKLSLKVLHLANKDSLVNILNNLLLSPVAWTEEQFKNVLALMVNVKESVDFSSIKFKENLINLLKVGLKEDIFIPLSSATDILRLATGLSDGDITLNENSRFVNFKRKVRRQLLEMLEKTSNLEDDLTRYKGKWKRLFEKLHPSDYKLPRVNDAYDKLYNNKLKSFNSKIEAYIDAGDVKVFGPLASRPGEFMRRLNKLITVFGMTAADNFISILDKLTVHQLLKIRKYLETVNDRKFKTIAPKGNWTKLQILPNDVNIDSNIQGKILNSINEVLRTKFDIKVKLDESAKNVKLQTNESDLTPYGRGTVFNIPENIKFIRTASYWKKVDRHTTWYDNGWNFFNENWYNEGTCCWNATNFKSGSSIFSGDPVNSTEMKGRACQMVDLYIDKLVAKGIRYAVWNVLCYSKESFNKAEDVFAALQWGEDPQKGKLFEPSRCQLAFPIKGDNLTKYVAYIDLVERKLVYMDANLYGDVSSANNNGPLMSEKMPAFVEYLNTLPSVWDLFDTVQDDSGVPVMYSDENIELKEGQKAYVFKPINENNDFEQLKLSNYL